MANAFSRAKDNYEMVKKAQAIQKALKQTEIEASSSDGTITVVFNGEMHLTGLTIAESWLAPEKKRDLEKALTNTIGQAISKAQIVQAEEAKKLMGDLKLPADLIK